MPMSDIHAAHLARAGPLARLYLALEAERDHWAVFKPVLFGIGIGFYFGLSAEPDLWPLITVVALLAAAYRPSHGGSAIVLGCCLIVAGGCATAKIRTEWVRAPVLEKRTGQVEVRGYVLLAEPQSARGQRLTLAVTRIGDLTADKLPARVRVRVMSRQSAAKPGDAVKLKATLAPPAGPALPEGYDFARTAWYQAIGGVGYSLALPEIDSDAPSTPPGLRLSALVEAVRQAIGARIRDALPGEAGAIANALITGERGGISEKTNDAYRDAGLYHILSISGLHMVIMAGTVFFVVRLVLAAFPRVALRYPIKKWAAVVAALAALAYLLISGSAFATVRSYIMISIMFLAVVLDRPALAMRNVALAAMIILVLYPESLLDVGFQMSFAAVAALVAAYEYIGEKRSHAGFLRRTFVGRGVMFFGGIVLSTIVAGVAVAPFAAFHFHTGQQFGVLANLITIPVCNFIVMPAALLAMLLMPLGLEGVPLQIMGFGIDAMTWCARWTAGLPGAVTHIRAIPTHAFLMMVGGGLWVLLWRARWRSVGFAGIAAGIAAAPFMSRPDLLIGRDGTLVAVRDDRSDRYAAIAARNGNFELKRWLEHDGDPREARQALRAAAESGVACDGIGCTVAAKQRKIAMTRHPSALRDDCRRADILILDIPRPAGCAQPQTVIDFWALRRLGTHAVYLSGDGAARIETVAQHRGERPWVAQLRLPEPRISRSSPDERRSAKPALADDNLRPEVEEDDEAGMGED